MKVSTLVFIFVLIETSVWGGAVDSDFQRAQLAGRRGRREQLSLSRRDACLRDPLGILRRWREPAAVFECLHECNWEISQIP